MGTTTEEPNNNALNAASALKDNQSQEKLPKKVLAVLFMTLVLDLLAFTCILPLFPSIMDYYSSRPETAFFALKNWIMILKCCKNLDWLYSYFDSLLKNFRKAIGAPDVARYNSVFFGGVLGSLFSFLQFVSSPLLGALSDVYGRKAIMLLSVAGSLCSYLLWSQSYTFSLFVLSRALGGLSKASISIATAIIADVCGPTNRGKGMACIGVSFSVGFLLGPSIGAYFASRARAEAVSPTAFYFGTPAYFAVVLTVLELICITMLMPETLPEKKRKTSIGDVFNQATNFVNPRSLFNFLPVKKDITSSSLSSLQRLGSVYFLYLFLYSGLEFTLSFLTHQRFNYNSMQQGRMYFFTGLLMVLIQGGYVRRIPAANQVKAAQYGVGFIVPAFVIVGLAVDHILLYTGLALFSLASGIVVPCLSAVVSSHGSDSEKGAIMGVFRSLGALARAVGPLIASAVFWCVGPMACYVAGGILLIIPYMMLRKIKV